MNSKVAKVEWKTAPISCTCEVLLSLKPLKFCEAPTVAAYPTMGGGWQSLCFSHAMKHPEAPRTDALIKAGETWK